MPQQGVPFVELNDLNQDIEQNVGFDLNQPMEEDLGGIDDLMLGAGQQNEVEAPVQGNHEQVIDEGMPSDESGNQVPALLPDLNEVNQVEVFIPMHEGVPLQIIPDEVQMKDLMEVGQHIEDHLEPEGTQPPPPAVEFLEAQGNQFPTHANVIPDSEEILASNQPPVPLESQDPTLEEHQIDQNNEMHLGFVQLIQSPLDPTLAASQPEVLFSLPSKCPGKTTTKCLAQLPSEDSLLKKLSPGSTPVAGQLCSDASDKNIGVQDSPPASSDLPNLENVMPSGPWSHALLAQAFEAKNRSVLVDTDVRRSARKQDQLKGYKHNKDTCTSKTCLGCSKEPPILSPTVIKNLGETFCKIDSDQLNEKALLKKRKAVAPSAKPPVKAKPGKKKDKDDAEPSKKASKKQTKK
ncbi:unnamed protein product [Urochloa decumbens]|uniref:Uncharacterized protein n=1 Tax=Urochloa decumbens TaxID=240449 RepID=A0ABC9D602_9POAL